jgi:hypothetical protein
MYETVTVSILAPHLSRFGTGVETLNFDSHVAGSKWVQTGYLGQNLINR